MRLNLSEFDTLEIVVNGAILKIEGSSRPVAPGSVNWLPFARLTLSTEGGYAAHTNYVPDPATHGETQAMEILVTPNPIDD